MKRSADRNLSRRLARTAFVAALAAAAAAAVLSLVFAETALSALDKGAAFFRSRLGRRLDQRHGLAFYSTLDAGIPENRVTGIPLSCRGCGVVPGVRREARRLDGEKGARVAADVRWNRFAPNGGTLFFWLDAEASRLEQRLCWARSSGIEMGLRILGDRTLEAVFNDASGRRSLAAPFPEPGRFVPVAFVLGAGRAELWIDGRRAAASDVAGEPNLSYRPISFDTDGHAPPRCSVDEASVWHRPLSAEEIGRLSASRGRLDRRLEPAFSLCADALRAAADSFRTALRAADRLVPARSGPAVTRTDVPELVLMPSKKDRRRFLAGHEASLRAGFRTRKAAEERTILVRWRGRVEEASICLDDSYGPGSPPFGSLRQRPARRRSYVLRGAPGVFAPGAGLARLVPPERFADEYPDAPGPLPVARDRLVRLFSGGTFLGVYVLEPFDQAGGAWRGLGEFAALRSDHLFRNGQPAAPSSARERTMTPAEAEAGMEDVLSLLRSDTRFPWSAAEARWRARLHARRRGELGFAAPRLSELDLMGNNPSPLYVTNDIDLAAAGPDVSWRSSDPATLDVDSTVCPACCDGDLPRTVELTGTFPDGTERTFRFRVMPETPRLPALFLQVAKPVAKDRRVDFACVRIPAGGGAPEAATGTAGTGGGVRHRGNTSYLHGARRSYSLEFDRPVDWCDDGRPLEKLLLFSGYADCTRLKNALSFEAFSAMLPPGTPPGTAFSWTELFVDGEYAGVWEVARNPKEQAEPWADALYKVRTPDGIWEAAGTEMLDRMDETKRDEDPFGPYLEAFRFVSEADDATFAARAGDLFDLDNLEAFLVLLNFTGNTDGRITNQYLARRKADGRWVVLPWDYDKTFRGSRLRTAWLANALLGRCLTVVPGFRDRAAAKWADLRAGPLSDEAVSRWIAERRDLLEPFMEEDFRVTPPGGFDGTYREGVAILEEEVLFRIHQLDGRLPKPNNP